MPERDERGRFVKGNRASPGRPKRNTETRYLEIMMAEVTPEYWAGITRRAIADALKGLPEARRWLSDYVIGKPPTTLNINAADANLLGDVLKALEQRGVSASELFNDLLAGLAEMEVANDGQ